MIDGWGRATLLALAGFLAVAVVACEDDDTTSASPTPTDMAGTATATPTDSPAATATAQPNGTPRAPEPGPCPVQAEICDAAIDVFQRVEAGDIDALMADAAPQPLECFGPGTGGFPYDDPLCGDAPAGTVLDGFLVSHGGEGAYATAAQFRDWLDLTVAHAATAQQGAQDGYGSGELRIAAIGCFSEGDTPAGECGREWIELVLTHISEEQPPGEIGGLPGRYVTCLEMYWPEDGPPGLSGGGCGVPPEPYLGELDLGASTGDLDGRFRNYPWTPPAGLLATYPWSTRTGIAVLDSVLAALEMGGPVPIQGTQIRCVEDPRGLGAPPECPEGVAEGTPVDAFFSSTCEGSWGLLSEIHPDQFVRDIVGPQRLFAVGRPDPPSRGVEEGGGPPSDYLIALAFPLSDGGKWESAPYTLGVRDAGVVSAHISCGGTLEGYANDPTLIANGWLLPPR
jgi:hypothetical protein